MTPDEVRQKYLDFFASQNHAIVPSSPLVPENDPTTLFTGSGMQPMVPYLLGQKHPLGTRIADSQKCFRSQDIEEVGDNRHTTFFEMFGNWSLGDYFKQEQLRWFFTFLTDAKLGLGIDPRRLFVTVFKGDESIGVPKDTQSVKIWQQLFAEKNLEAKDVDNAQEVGLTNGRIFYYEAKKNWWSRSGVPANMPVGEPGGPDSEVFYDFGEELELHQKSDFANLPCHVNCDCGRFLEIGNSVFMEYVKTDQGFQKLPAPNVDFGGGFERLLAVMNQQQDVFLTALFQPIIEVIEKVSGQKYDYSPSTRRSFRVIADHLKAAVMLASDGVFPSNKAQGYFSRRLVRRAIRYARMIGVTHPFIAQVVVAVAAVYQQAYPQVSANLSQITQILVAEESKFQKALEKGLKEIEKIDVLSAQSAFHLYETYGFPFELTQEIAAEKGVNIAESDFIIEKNAHAQQSRTSSVGMFKGGLQDHSEQTTKFHTATHLLHAALRSILGRHVMQKGSNITHERLRFDFTHPQALTTAEKQQVEQQINDWIKQDLIVTKQIMQKDQALKSGAIAFFIEKYPDEVSVYTIGADPNSNWISKEFCGGPHVSKTGAIGPIKIIKEQAVADGVRRIYLVSAI